MARVSATIVRHQVSHDDKSNGWHYWDQQTPQRENLSLAAIWFLSSHSFVPCVRIHPCDSVRACVPFCLGIVLVRPRIDGFPDYVWPARLISYQEYLHYFVKVPTSRKPHKRVVGVVVFAPFYRPDTWFSLDKVDATAADIQPFDGLENLGFVHPPITSHMSHLSSQATSCLLYPING